MPVYRLVTVVVLAWAVLNATYSYSENYAVFVGVNRYDNAVHGDFPIGDLRCCVGDMLALKEALIKAQFVTEKNTRTLTSETETAPTKNNVLAAVDDLLRRIGPDNTVFFAFAGHGLSLSEDGKSGDVLCCSDAKIVRFGHCEGLIYRSELEKMLSRDPSNAQKVAPKVTIFMFDACRDIPSVEPRPGGRSIRGFGNRIGTHAQINYPNTIRLASCASGQVSNENKFGIDQGLFTHFLIRGLEGEANKRANGGKGDGIITLPELFDYARRETQNLVPEQTPTKSEVDLELSTSELVIGKCAAERAVIPSATAPPTPSYTPPRTTSSGTRGTTSGGNRGNLGRSGSGR